MYHFILYLFVHNNKKIFILTATETAMYITDKNRVFFFLFTECLKKTWRIKLGRDSVLFLVVT